MRGKSERGAVIRPSFCLGLSAGCGSAGSDCGSGSAHGSRCGSRCSARSGFRSDCGSSPSCQGPPFSLSGHTLPGRGLFCPEWRKEIPKRRKISPELGKKFGKAPKSG